MTIGVIRSTKVLLAVCLGLDIGASFHHVSAVEVQQRNSLTAVADAAYAARDFDRAITEYTRILTLKLPPEQASIVINRRSNCYFKKHDFARALADIERAIQLNPRNSAAYDNRAMILEIRDRRFDEALKNYDEAIRLDPRNTYAYVNRASFFRDRGQVERALSDYFKAVSINPHAVGAHSGLASIYLRRKDISRAWTEINEAITDERVDARNYAIRSTIRLTQGDYAGAIEDANKATSLKNSDWEYGLNAFAWIRCTCPDAKFRNGSEAIEYARKACELTRWQKPSMIDTLAAASAEVGEFEQAIKYQQLAIGKLSPTNPSRAELNSRLDLYRKHQPYREPVVR